jgi:hypothetical protein
LGRPFAAATNMAGIEQLEIHSKVRRGGGGPSVSGCPG